MKELVNEAIIEMVNDSLLSVDRIKGLVYIKELIDRIATKNYIDKDTVKSIEKKYGVAPNIITWGDYFQTEMASSLMVLSDDEFEKAVETVKFDMIASCIIFSDKDSTFFEWIERMYTDITLNKDSGYNEEEEEIIHLKILMDYYRQMGIVNNFTPAEMKWYEMYEEAQVI